jgi:hypothetical protein
MPTDPQVNIQDKLDVITKYIEQIAQTRLYTDEVRAESVDKLDKGLAKYSKDLRNERNKFGSYRNIFNQRTSRGFFRELTRAIEYGRTKDYLRRKFPNATEAQISAEARKTMQQTGRGLGKFSNLLMMASGALNLIVVAANIASEALKSLGERSKYYDAAIRTGQGDLGNIPGLFEGSKNILQSLRDPRKVGWIFSGSEQFKESFRNLLSSGTFGTGKGPGAVDQLIQSYKYIASQGILLGNTLNDTAKNVADISSIYNLTLGTKDPLKQYAVVNKAIEHGIINGLNQANVLNFYKQYSKSAAVAEKGFLTVTRDLLYGIAAIKSAQGMDQAQMQQYFSALQSLTSNRMDFGSWAGLVDRRQVYSKGSLEGAMRRWQDSSVLTQKMQAYSYLSQQTGLGPAAITTLFPQYFQGMDNKIGRDLITRLTGNPALYKEFIRDYGKKDTAEQLAFLKGKLKLDKETVDQITNAAQWSELLNNPMKAIVDILQNMLRFVATMATSSIFRMATGGHIMSMDEVKAYAASGTKTNGQISNGPNFGAFSK